MANPLGGQKDNISREGMNIYVKQKEIAITVGIGSKLFEIWMWLWDVIPAIICFAAKTPIYIPVIVLVVGALPGIIFQVKKVKAKNALDTQMQKIQHDASLVGNYYQKKLAIIQDLVKIVDKSIDFDKSTYETIAAYRGGSTPQSGAQLNEYAQNVDKLSRNINIALENYPNLESHRHIEDLMQQVKYLNSEIVAAREVYNDSVYMWNRMVYRWPTMMIVAAKNGYTTMIPFTADADVIERASGSVL